MPLRFWIYLTIKVIMIIVITFVAVLILLPSNHWILSALPSYFAVSIFGTVPLDEVIERKIKKLDNKADAEENKAMLKRYMVIDRIMFGFYFILLFCIAIRWVRSWFP